MRILQVHNRYRHEGGEDTTVRMERGVLERAGHDVVLYEARNPYGSLRAGARLALAPWNPLAATRLARRVEADRFDLAHVHNTWYSLTPSVISRMRGMGLPVVMSVQNYRLMCGNALLLRDGGPCELCVGTHPWHGVRYRCYRNSVLASTAVAVTIATHQSRGTWERDVDLFLTPTAFARDRLVAGGLPEDRIVVKPNFVEDPGDRLRPPSASDTILFVGRLSSEKGLDVVLRAWGDAPAGLRLSIIGDGPDRGRLEDVAPSGVTFEGSLAPGEVLERMSGSRGLVFPSIWYEGQPLVLLEALSAGLPALASDLGGMAETVSPLGKPWLVPAGDARAWTTALEMLADDTEVDRAGTLARQAYRDHHSPVVGLKRLLAAYRTVTR